MNWKKYFTLTIAACSMMIPGATEAVYQQDCCVADECCEDGWELSADWIYWRTRTCKLDYAIPYGSNDSENDVSIGSVHSAEPGYDSGFRLGVSKDCNCWSYGIGYTYYRTSADDTYKRADGFIAGTHILDDFNSATQGNIQLATSSWDLDYDVIDLSLGRDWDVNNCFSVKFFGGFKFAYINQHFNNLYQSVEDVSIADRDSVKQQICMDGYGLGFGFTPEYQLNQCFSLFGSFSYDAFVSKFNRTFKYDTSDEGAPFETKVNLKDSCWGSVSTFNLAVGIKFIKENFCSCGDLSFSIGYEFQNWLNSAGFLENQNESSEITFDRYNENLGFDGLFVRLNVSY
jgi:Legionella pneumophila major outer membrane protein precursor